MFERERESEREREQERWVEERVEKGHMGGAKDKEKPFQDSSPTTAPQVRQERVVGSINTRGYSVLFAWQGWQHQ
jgi:hypothetical protein